MGSKWLVVIDPDGTPTMVDAMFDTEHEADGYVQNFNLGGPSKYTDGRRNFTIMEAMERFGG